MTYEYDRTSGRHPQKLARLPAGSSWRGAPNERYTSVITPSGEWLLTVTPRDDKEVMYDLTFKNPQKQDYRWKAGFKGKDAAIKDAEIIAHALKRRGDIGLAGWVKV